MSYPALRDAGRCLQESAEAIVVPLDRNEGPNGTLRDRTDDVRETGDLEGGAEKPARRHEDNRAEPGEWRGGRDTQAGRGQRMLGVPTVLDRFIQQALLQVLAPIFDRAFPSTATGFGPDAAPNRRCGGRRNTSKRESAGLWTST